MKAVTYHGKRDVRVENVADPTIQLPTDAITRVTSSGLCGSDLHLYETLGAFMGEGDILSLEPMGIVEAIGGEVTNLKVGDRVVVPFNISCGNCYMCNQGLHSQCETTQVHEHNTGASLFSFSKLYGEVPGGQAEYLRVPFANTLPIKVPEGPSDDRFLFLSDVLPTAWQAVDYAAIPKHGSVVVLGLGPIGEMATRIAKQHGVHQVIGVGLVPERLERARNNGVETVDLNDHEDDLVQVIRSMTHGRGPDSVIDAVGMGAHGSPAAKAELAATSLLPNAVARKLMKKVGADQLTALHSAIEIVRRGGTVSVIGVYGGMTDPMPMMTMFDKQIQLRMGQANVKRWVDDIMPLLLNEDVLGVDQFATHHVAIEDAPDAYEMFQKRQDGAIKVVFKP